MASLTSSSAGLTYIGNGADCIVHCDESDKLRRGVLKSTKKFAVVNCRLRSESA
ncbi:hypothetical protein T08_1694 [Trichinella sp. T8]|nr:hypothetical protein T08_7685 [Trichinella sp. T8]KRZ82495.1 hypothetical protein T08_1694 [Trichinella sp. T8]